MLSCLLSAAITLFVYLPANALEKTCTYSLTPYGGYHVFDNARDYKDNAEVGLRAEYFFNKIWSIEAAFGNVHTDLKSCAVCKDVQTYSLNGVYNIPSSDSRFNPYLTAGLSGDYVDSTTLTGLDAGVGARWFFTERIALRPEARYINLFKERDEFLVMLGLNFFFGCKAPAPQAAPPPPAPVPVAIPVDSDHDGVPDSLDKCPNTPAGVKVDRNGCPLDSDHDGVPDYLDQCAGTPAGVKVDKNGCPLDSDHDGVPDYLDKCPDTPAGVNVDENGCPLDSDQDGVPDYLDKCPDTPRGARVDKDGCVESITLHVRFDTGKTIVKKEFYPEIEDFAAYLNRYPDSRVELQGHTDNRGNPKKNVTLSQNRAKAIMDVLVKKYNIDAARLSAKGLGQNDPIATNDTEEGRERNRRVEAVVIK
jgi:OmpA-OmpF porin, OOP family